MEVGCFGSVTFEVSSNRVQTINDFSRSGSANYAEHQRAGGTTLLEFTGTGAEKVTLKALISEYLGSDPVSEYATLWKYMRNAVPKTLVIGDGKVGRNRWVITSLSQTAKIFDKRGNVSSCEVSMSLQEYEGA